MSQPFDSNFFAHLIGEAEATLSPELKAQIRERALSFHTLSGSEREACMLKVLTQMDQKQMTVSGAHRLSDWERGWTENLEQFLQSGGNPESLVPRYHQPDQIDRCQGEYIRSDVPYFQVRFYELFRHYVFQTWFVQVPEIWEFGCGTGYNLTLLARMFPDKKLKGLDWAQASVDLVRAIADAQGFLLSSTRFDMFYPDKSLNIPPGSAVMTFNAMEQLGKNFQAFVDYLCQQPISLAVHSEPLLELYDQSNLFDYLAVRYHRKRGYLEGFVPYMQQLHARNQIELLHLQRIPFGNQFHEGYSLLIWKPRRNL